ncbi:hypothetical protein FKM82_010032 [Ascaphus truei]|uniref:antileukoproteinase-like n=1 Tax=Ascaphus truei TaxID=8439 RepID=UPI003F59C55E
MDVDYLTCDIVPEFGELNVAQECYSGRDCKGELMCCLSGCTLHCVPPMKVNPVVYVKPGDCPQDVDYPTCDAVPLAECNIDQNCKETKKCCYSGCLRLCLLPLKAKRGICPRYNASLCIGIKPLPDECHADNQCPGTDKCCKKCRYQCTPAL